MRRYTLAVAGFLVALAVGTAWGEDIDRSGRANQVEFTGTTAAANVGRIGNPSYGELVGAGAELSVPQGETLPADPPVASAPPKKPPANPYKWVYYDNDFSYLDDPDNEFHYLGDFAKRRRIGDWAVLDVGGEFRLRQQNEHLLTRFDNFLLQRTRIYGDLHVQDWLRIYVEALDAVSYWGNLAPRPIEENRFDAENLFADLRVWDGGSGDLWLRGGRQELLYGAQRLISPLDWVNTRRTFDGVKMFWTGEDWNADFFWTRPVPPVQHLESITAFDHPDPLQEFYGLWMTRKGLEHHKIDLSYLRLGNYNPATPGGPILLENHTFGARWEGNYEDWLAEIEGGYQFGAFTAPGTVATLDQSAGFYTIGGGRKWSGLSWKPVVWLYYDWASGDHDPEDDRRGTFNQLFPFGHPFFGFMDLVGRQNIEDWNCKVTMAPRSDLEFLLWYHVMHLQQSRDALYDAAGTAIRRDPTGASGRDVGSELDLTLRWTFRPRADVLFGYSHLFPGRFLLDTGGAPGRDFYYTQFSLRF